MEIFIDSIDGATEQLAELVKQAAAQHTQISESDMLQAAIQSLQKSYAFYPQQLRIEGEYERLPNGSPAPLDWWIHSLTDDTWLGFHVELFPAVSKQAEGVPREGVPLITRQQLWDMIHVGQQRGMLPLIMDLYPDAAYEPDWSINQMVWRIIPPAELLRAMDEEGVNELQRAQLRGMVDIFDLVFPCRDDQDKSSTIVLFNNYRSYMGIHAQGGVPIGADLLPSQGIQTKKPAAVSQPPIKGSPLHPFCMIQHVGDHPHNSGIQGRPSY